MSSCPICKSRDGFPQTVQREKVSGNMYVVTSYSQSIQYVFCKECRVQFEPLVTWADFNASIRNAEIARERAKEREQRDKELEKERLRIASLSPAERVLHDSPTIAKGIKTRFRLLRLFFVSLAIGIAYLWSDYPLFTDLSTALKIFISASYLVVVMYVLRVISKRQASRMSDVLEDENRARKETGYIYPRP